MADVRLARAENTNGSAQLDRRALRPQLQNLSPEERRAKIQELRKQRGPAPNDLSKLREEMKKLTPEQRRARLKELREKNAGSAAKQHKSLSPEEHRGKLKDRLEELRSKKANGSITPQEQKLLDRMDQAVKRMQDRAPKTQTERPKENSAETT